MVSASKSQRFKVTGIVTRVKTDDHTTFYIDHPDHKRHFTISQFANPNEYFVPGVGDFIEFEYDGSRFVYWIRYAVSAASSQNGHTPEITNGVSISATELRLSCLNAALEFFSLLARDPSLEEIFTTAELMETWVTTK